MKFISDKLTSHGARAMVVGSLAVVLLVIGRESLVTPDSAAAPVALSHVGVAAADMFTTQPFFVDPGNTVAAFTVPEGKTFILTDVIVFPDLETGSISPDYLASYNLRENGVTKFRFRSFSTTADRSHHFSGGIAFASSGDVNVALDYFSKGRVYFQLMGYFTTP